MLFLLGHFRTQNAVALVFTDDSDDLMRQHSMFEKLAELGIHASVVAWKFMHMLTTRTMESASRILRE